MTYRLPLALAAACLAPADAIRADAPPATVAEIVEFRLTEGTTPDAFLSATRDMQPLVAAAPGFVSRNLSQNPDGSWTDYIVWQSLAQAQSAAETIFEDPVTAPFARAIDPDSIRMRHEPILFAPSVK